MAKFEIGFYSFYQIFDSFDKSNQTEIANTLKKIAINLEKEINSSLKKENYYFKIYYDIVSNKNANEKHFTEILNKNIRVVLQPPNYFKSNNWKNILKDKICFDSFDVLKDKKIDNVYQTPLGLGTEKEMKKAISLLGSDKLIRLVCIDEADQEINKEKINEIQLWSKKNKVRFKLIENWKQDNFSNLRSFFKDLNKDDTILLDAFTIHHQNCEIKTKAENRTNLITEFIKADSEGRLCGFRIDPRLLDTCLKAEYNKHPNILSFVSEEFMDILLLQDKVISANKNLDKNTTKYINWCFLKDFDKIYLIKYLLEKSSFKFTTNQEFTNEINKRIKQLNGRNDYFLGFGGEVYFKNNIGNNRRIYLTELQKTSNNKTSLTLYKKQAFFEDERLISMPVNFPNFDFIGINNISIEESLFDANFYFEITTKFEEGIEILRFNNAIKDSFEAKLLKKEKLDDDFFYFRYHISSSFSFIPIAENYPFDIQTVFISYTLVDRKYGMLQTIKSQDLNSKFDSDGWDLISFKSGLLRKKESFHPVLIDRYIQTSEDNNVGIVLSRPSSLAVVKLLIPLIFLAALVVYGLFLPLDLIERNIALSTTSFLSAIALYFSSERPKPLSLTNIDLIFLLFYFFVGSASISFFILSFFPDVYDFGLKVTRWALLTYSIGCFIYLTKRIRSNKFIGRMNIEKNI